MKARPTERSTYFFCIRPFGRGWPG